MQEAFAETQLRMQQFEARLLHIEQTREVHDPADELRSKILTLIDYASFYNSKEDFIQALRFAIQEKHVKAEGAKAMTNEYFDDTRPDIDLQASLKKPSSLGEDTFMAMQIERDNVRRQPKASNFGPNTNLRDLPATGHAAEKKVNLREDFTSERAIPFLDPLTSSKLIRSQQMPDASLLHGSPDDRFVRIELRKMPSGKRHSLPDDSSPLEHHGGIKSLAKRKPSKGPDHREFFEDAHLQTSELNHSDHSPRDSIRELVFQRDRYNKAPTKKTDRDRADSNRRQESGRLAKNRPEITVTMKQSDSSSLDDDNDSSPQPNNLSYYIQKI